MRSLAVRAHPFLASVRPRIVALVRDWPRYYAALSAPGNAYLRLCNRSERLEDGPAGQGWRCLWLWTSDLSAPKWIPSLGRALLRRSLKDRAISIRQAPIQGGKPDIAFVIGHRGEARLPHLLATLGSIAGQVNANIECIVVEQDDRPLARRHLPTWVRHVHAPPIPGMPYCRSWAFNVGVRIASAPLLVLHDNDMLVTEDYASTALHIAESGYEAMNLKRFVFYMPQGASEGIFEGKSNWMEEAPEVIVQNLEAGGSVVITREAFVRIGGMDEAFVGWGGEDNEFWERCATLKVWPWGSLPLVHCWHAPQPGKENAARDTTTLWQQKARIPVQERIALLRAMPSGAMSGPQGAP